MEKVRQKDFKQSIILLKNSKKFKKDAILKNKMGIVELIKDIKRIDHWAEQQVREIGLNEKEAIRFLEAERDDLQKQYELGLAEISERIEDQKRIAGQNKDRTIQEQASSSASMLQQINDLRKKQSQALDERNCEYTLALEWDLFGSDLKKDESILMVYENKDTPEEVKVRIKDLYDLSKGRVSLKRSLDQKIEVELLVTEREGSQILALPITQSQYRSLGKKDEAEKRNKPLSDRLLYWVAENILDQIGKSSQKVEVSYALQEGLVEVILPKDFCLELRDQPKEYEKAGIEVRVINFRNLIDENNREERSNTFNLVKAAEYIGISRGALAKEVNSGRIGAIRVPGRGRTGSEYRFEISELDDYMERRG